VPQSDIHSNRPALHPKDSSQQTVRRNQGQRLQIGNDMGLFHAHRKNGLLDSRRIKI